MLGRYVVCSKPAPFPEFSLPDLGRYPIYINKDRYQLAEHLSQKLRDRGIETIVAERVPSTARHLIYIGLANDCVDAEQLYEINYAAFAAARRIASGMEQDGGMFVTVQSTGGDFGLGGVKGNQAGTAGLAALAKTAMKEWPKASVKAIDFDFNTPVAVMADQLCEELFRGGLEKEIGFLADGTRLAAGVEISERRLGQTRTLAPRDTLLVSGGARGITSHAVLALARKQPLHFILLGRTAYSAVYPDGLEDAETVQELTKKLYERASAEGKRPSPLELQSRAKAIAASREIRDTIERLRQLGSEVCYVHADITNSDSLLSVLKPITAQWGPIRGIVHGAGVLADKRIKDKQDDAFRIVFSTKVAGFQAMLNAVEAEALKLIVMFSSVAAREGNAGQCDYAMANEVLNKMAHQLRRSLRESGSDVVVKALNWGPWEGGMVSPELKRHFQAQDVPIIPMAAGAELFAEEADTANLDEVEIVIGGGRSANALLGAANRERIWKLEKTLAARQFEWLDDHRIDGKRVIPIVVIHEWLYRFAQSAYPDLAVRRMEHVRVMKGIRIPADHAAPLKLLVTGTERRESGQQGIRIEMKICDSEGIWHYAGQAILDRRSTEPNELPVLQEAGSQRPQDASSGRSQDAVSRRPQDAGSCRSEDVGSHRRQDAGSHRPQDAGSGRSEDVGGHRSQDAGSCGPEKTERRKPQSVWDLPPDHIYGTLLYHGPYFQVIDRLLTCTDERAVGLLRATAVRPSVEGSSLDGFAVLLDGGLQLAGLWGYEKYRQPSFPMAIGSSYISSRQPYGGTIRCEVAVKRHNTHQYVVDIAWFDQQERCFARLVQVEMYVVKERRTR